MYDTMGRDTLKNFIVRPAGPTLKTQPTSSAREFGPKTTGPPAGPVAFLRCGPSGNIFLG